MRYQFLLLAALVRCATAQETLNSASVGGRITDSTGAVVDGASVVARQTETNIKAEARTDREGRFRFAYLKVGPYELTVTKPGFAELQRALTLTVGAAFELPLALSVESKQTNVVASAPPPPCHHHRRRRSPCARRPRRSMRHRRRSSSR